MIECYPAVVSPRPVVDPGDLPAHRPFKKQAAQVLAIRSGRAAFQDAGQAEQAGSLCGPAVGVAAAADFSALTITEEIELWSSRPPPNLSIWIQTLFF